MSVYNGMQSSIARIEHSAGYVVLPLGVVYVGRGMGCLLWVDDPTVSRLHLEIQVGEQILVRDLGSRNGSMLNGQPLYGTEALADGDVLELGDYTLRVYIDGADQPVYDEVTPPLRTGTLASFGNTLHVEKQCPSCRAEVSLQRSTCPSCGHCWQRALASQPTVETKRCEGEERRTSPRYAVELTAIYRNGMRELACQVVNFSCGGVLLTCGEPDEPGAACEVKFIPPGMRSATFTGRVVRVPCPELGDVAGMAIAFSEIKGPHLRWIAELLLKQQARADHSTPG